jgi:hypothetical protein
VNTVMKISVPLSSLKMGYFYNVIKQDSMKLAQQNIKYSAHNSVLLLPQGDRICIVIVGN